MAKKKFDWENFKGNSKMCVHCQTEHEAKEFCRLMHEHGMKWIGGKSYLTINHYINYKEKTCYYGDGEYCDLEWADIHGDKICMFSKYDFTD